MGAKKNVGFPSESYQRIKSGEEIFQETKERSVEEQVEEIERKPVRKFGGVERLMTASTRGLRSAPRSPTAAYLDLYMLLKKKEAMERHTLSSQGRAVGYDTQLKEVLKDVKKLEESTPELRELREAAEAEGKGKQAAKKVPREGWKEKDWKVVDIEY